MLSLDDAGLPVLSWDESSSVMKCLRKCYLAQADDGALLFVHEHRTTAGWEGYLWMVGLAVVAGGFAAMALVAVIHDNLLGYRTMSPAALMLALLAAAIGASISGRASYRLFAREETKRTSAPWSELKAFVVTDHQTFLGAPRSRQTPGGGVTYPAAPVPVIFADFGAAAAPMVLSIAGAQQATLLLHQGVLTREFIDQRPEHFSRLARDDRNRANDAVGTRRKVV